LLFASFQHKFRTHTFNKAHDSNSVHIHLSFRLTIALQALLGFYHGLPKAINIAEASPV
uniref:Uncharacterized protein n=1 Tax=Oryza brachyantha TaxID=4533 RepID=J3N2G2_ORYBR